MRFNKVEIPESSEQSSERIRESTYETRTETFLAMLVEPDVTRWCIVGYAKETKRTIKTVTKATGGLK